MLQQLETRRLMAVTAAIDDREALVIVGDNIANTVTLTDTPGDPTRVSVARNGQSTLSFSKDDFNFILIELKGGDDQADVTTDVRRVKVLGDAGNDFIRVLGISQGEVFVELDLGDGDDDAAVSNVPSPIGRTTITVDGGNGNDRFEANQSFRYDERSNRPDNSGDGGCDTVIGSPGDDSITGAEVVTAGGGQDAVVSLADLRFGELDLGVAAQFDLGEGNDSFFGDFASRDFVTGGPGDDLIIGGDGPDTILAGDGADEIYGDKFFARNSPRPTPGTVPGAGDDSIDAGNGNDVIFGGGGNDLILAGDGADRVYGDAYAEMSATGNDTIVAAGGMDSVLGGPGKDRINGGRGSDALDGWSGNDRIDGGDGNDKILGGAGNDTLTGEAGRDYFSGGRGDDLLLARDNARDVLDGGSDNDRAQIDALLESAPFIEELI